MIDTNEINVDVKIECESSASSSEFLQEEKPCKHTRMLKNYNDLCNFYPCYCVQWESLVVF